MKKKIQFIYSLTFRKLYTSKRMSHTFIKRYNAIRDTIEWEPEVNHFDDIQSVARSGYADMLHDRHRNQLYSQAIKKTIQRMKKEGKQIDALDIGTGTGLLAMMTAKHDVHQVYACECFEPMAKCAEKIIARNGFKEKIKLIPKRSDELKVGPNADMKQTANLLVTELFDTELIGEGALPAFRHALKHLLDPNPSIIPSKARIYAQLVQSEKIIKWHQLNAFNVDQISINPPESVLKCSGTNVLHDIQLNQLTPDEDFKIVTEPKVIFEFQFNDIHSLKKDDHKVIEFEAISDINGPLVILMWWDLDMDQEGEIVLSCAPHWIANEDYSSLPWRDHWMQAIYYFPAYKTNFSFKAHEMIKIEAHHDDYSLWFNELDDTNKFFPICKCGHHLFISRQRLGMMNDVSLIKTYNDVIESYLNKSKESVNGLFLGDSSLLPIIASKHKNVNKIICYAKNKMTEHFLEDFGKTNDCLEKICIVNKLKDIEEKINFIFAEPYFSLSELPWNHLHYWYLLSHLPSGIVSSDAVLMPFKAAIRMIPIELDHLWKIRAPVGNNVEGFDLSLFDEMIQEAILVSDPSIESQPLWEYPGKALDDKPIDLFVWDLKKPLESQKYYTHDVWLHPDSFTGSQNVSLALWVEIYLTENIIINTGPVGSIQKGEYIRWNRNYKQGVSFLPKNKFNDRKNVEKCDKICLHFIFDAQNGELKCSIRE